MTLEEKLELLGWDLVSADETDLGEPSVWCSRSLRSVTVSEFEVMHPWDILDWWVREEPDRWADIGLYQGDMGVEIRLILSDCVSAWLGWGRNLEEALWQALGMKRAR